MSQESLNALLVDELRDLLDCENQLIKVLPKMAETANSESLRSGFENHLEQTKEHAKKLEQILQALGEKPKAKKCKGMQGIIAEGKKIMEEDFEGAVLDSALISAAQRVEHYEIAAYGCVREYARLLGQDEAVSLLSKTLEEEKETDQKLTDAAQQSKRMQKKLTKRNLIRKRAKRRGHSPPLPFLERLMKLRGLDVSGGRIARSSLY